MNHDVKMVSLNMLAVTQYIPYFLCIQAAPYLSHALEEILGGKEDSDVTVACDVISICSHLARTSPQHVQLIQTIVQGENSKI